MLDALEVGDVLELERIGHVHLLADVLVHHVDVSLVNSATHQPMGVGGEGCTHDIASRRKTVIGLASLQRCDGATVAYRAYYNTENQYYV